VFCRCLQVGANDGKASAAIAAMKGAADLVVATSPSAMIFLLVVIEWDPGVVEAAQDLIDVSAHAGSEVPGFALLRRSSPRCGSAEGRPSGRSEKTRSRVFVVTTPQAETTFLSTAASPAWAASSEACLASRSTWVILVVQGRNSAGLAHRLEMAKEMGAACERARPPCRDRKSCTRHDTMVPI